MYRRKIRLDTGFKNNINTVFEYDCNDFKKIRNFEITLNGPVLWINQEKSTRFFILRDDIEDQEVAIKLVYSLHLPPNPVKNSLVFEVRDENDNVVFKDENLPLISGDDIEYVWNGVFNQKNKEQSIAPVKYDFSLILTGAIVGRQIMEHISFHALKITPYIDKNFSIPLTDWKEGEEVSPRYLFGQSNKIYTHIEGWQSSWPDEMIVETNLGENLPLKIKIKEDDKKFVAESFLLDSTTNVKELKIKIENEEVLIFKIKNPTEIPQEPEDLKEGYKVKVDRAEPCIDWQVYEDGSIIGLNPMPSLDTSAKNIKAEIKSLFGCTKENFVTEKREYNTNRLFFDNKIINNYDIAVVAGHGRNKTVTRINKSGSKDFFREDITVTNYFYGTDDIEILIFDSCSVLCNKNDVAPKNKKVEKPPVGQTAPKFLPDDWSPCVKGVHAILGNASKKHIYSTTISYFIALLNEGESIKKAWKLHFENNYGWESYFDPDDDEIFKESRLRMIFPEGYVDEKFWNNGNSKLPVECMKDPSKDAKYYYLDFFWSFPEPKRE